RLERLRHGKDGHGGAAARLRGSRPDQMAGRLLPARHRLAGGAARSRVSGAKFRHDDTGPASGQLMHPEMKRVHLESIFDSGRPISVMPGLVPRLSGFDLAYAEAQL